jgi:hypothetical protein
MLLFQQPASHPSTQQQCRIQSTKQAMANYAQTLDCGWSSTITKCTLMFSIPQAIWRDPFPFPAAVSKQASKLESGAGLGERLVTVSRDLPEAPLVPALRGGVRVERHGAEIAAASFRRRPSARGPARPPGRLLVSWSRRGGDRYTTATTRKRWLEAKQEREIAASEFGRRGAMGRASLHSRKRSSSATGQWNYQAAPLERWTGTRDSVAVCFCSRFRQWHVGYRVLQRGCQIRWHAAVWSVLPGFSVEPANFTFRIRTSLDGLQIRMTLCIATSLDFSIEILNPTPFFSTAEATIIQNNNSDI